MLQKKLLSGLLWVLLLNLLVKPFWILGIEVGVQNAVGTEEYGLYFGIFNLAYILNILLDMGITNFNTRNIARHPHLIHKHFGGLLTIKLLLLALYLVVAFSVGLLKGYGSRQFMLLAFLTFNQFLNSLILYLRSNFEGLLLFKWDSVVSVLDRVAMILICGALLWLPGYPQFHIEYFVYAQTAAYLVTTLVALVVLLMHLRRDASTRQHLRIRISWPFAVAIAKRSAPFALLVLLMATYNRIDPLLLEDLASDGSHQAGIYASAFRLLDALTMVGYLVSVPLLPVFARLTKHPDCELRSTTRMVASLMLLFGVTAAVLCSATSEQLMTLLYREHSGESAAVFRVLVFGIIPISFTYIFGTLLTAAGCLKQLNLMAVATLGVGVAANLLLIPRMGAVGSAWASLSAQCLMAAVQMVAAMRHFHLYPSRRYTIKTAAFALLMVMFAFAVAPLLEWWGTALAGTTLAVGAAMALRLIDMRELTLILTSKE